MAGPDDGDYETFIEEVEIENNKKIDDDDPADENIDENENADDNDDSGPEKAPEKIDIIDLPANLPALLQNEKEFVKEMQQLMSKVSSEKRERKIVPPDQHVTFDAITTLEFAALMTTRVASLSKNNKIFVEKTEGLSLEQIAALEIYQRKCPLLVVRTRTTVLDTVDIVEIKDPRAPHMILPYSQIKKFLPHIPEFG